MTQSLDRIPGSFFNWTTNMPNLSLKNPLSLVWARRENSEVSVSYLRCKIARDPHHEPNPDIQKTFQTILANKAAMLLSRKPFCNGGPMGDCIYSFDNLYECSCPPLDRKKNGARQIYEDKIIENVAVLATNNQRIVITVFASGFLFSDLVVIVKLIHYLQSNGWAGKLEFNFIDLKYEPLQTPQSLADAVQEKERRITYYQALASLAFGWMAITLGLALKAKKPKTRIISTACATGLGGLGLFALNKLQTLKKEKEKLLQQKKTHLYVAEVQMKSGGDFPATASQAVTSLLRFLQEAVGSSSLVVKTRFFSKAKDYQDMCKTQAKFRCDLLLGSDVDNTAEVISSLQKTTQTPSGAGIILAKVNDQPKFMEWSKNFRPFARTA